MTPFFSAVLLDCSTAVPIDRCCVTQTMNHVACMWVTIIIIHMYIKLLVCKSIDNELTSNVGQYHQDRAMNF